LNPKFVDVTCKPTFLMDRDILENNLEGKQRVHDQVTRFRIAG
jgi:hypothetical protein